jgi:hypothetical protein
MPHDGAIIFGDLVGKADLLSHGLRQGVLASLCVCTLLCATPVSNAQIKGSFVEPHPGLGQPNPFRLPMPLRDANGNLLHHSGRPVEVSDSPVSVIIFYPTSIDVMQVFIPWEFRVAGVFER